MSRTVIFFALVRSYPYPEHNASLSFLLPAPWQFSVFPPVMLSAKPFSGSLLARSASKTTVGGGSTASVADVDSEGLQGQGPEGSEAAAAAEGGDRSSCRLLCPRPSSVGGGATMPTRVGRHGKPLLLPKPTLAAHNGRMLMEYEWAHAGFY